MSSPAPQPDPRLVLTVRTSGERHADGEYHAAISGRSALGTFRFCDGVGDTREEARALAIGWAIRSIGVDIAAGVIDAFAGIDIVDAPAEEP